MAGAPVTHLARKTVVHHVAEDESLVGGAADQGFAAQQGRHDVDVALEVVGHRAERQRQQFAASRSRHAGMEPQQESLDSGSASVGVENVVEQKLVGDAGHRDPDREAADGQSREQFVEVHDPVGLQLLDPASDQPHAAVEGLEPPGNGIGQERAEHADAPVAAVEGEARGFEFGDRGADAFEEEVGEPPFGAASDENADHLVAVAAEDAGEREGLGQVTAPFSLNGEQVTHRVSIFRGRSGGSPNCRRSPRPGR